MDFTLKEPARVPRLCRYMMTSRKKQMRMLRPLAPSPGKEDKWHACKRVPYLAYNDMSSLDREGWQALHSRITKVESVHEAPERISLTVWALLMSRDKLVIPSCRGLTYYFRRSMRRSVSCRATFRQHIFGDLIVDYSTFLAGPKARPVQARAGYETFRRV